MSDAPRRPVETLRADTQQAPHAPEVMDEVRKQIDRFFEMRDTFRKLTGPRRREILSRLLLS
jgi:hypothetical protein